MLRESSQSHAQDVNLDALMTGGEAGEINGGDALIELADTVVTGNETTRASARDALVQALGIDAMVDAVGVASNFQRMVRIADSTGITLENHRRAATEELRENLGINQFKK